VIRLCSVEDVAANSAKRFDVDGLRIALVRIGDDFYALGDRCSHADVSLSEGTLWVDECELECWKHGSTFSLKTGEPQSLPGGGHRRPAPERPAPPPLGFGRSAYRRP